MTRYTSLAISIPPQRALGTNTDHPGWGGAQNSNFHRRVLEGHPRYLRTASVTRMGRWPAHGSPWKPVPLSLRMNQARFFLEGLTDFCGLPPARGAESYGLESVFWLPLPLSLRMNPALYRAGRSTAR